MSYKYINKKFDYWLYYDFNKSIYVLKNRDNIICHTSMGFRTLYLYIKENGIAFNRIKLKSMYLNEFFRDFAYEFEERRERI